MKKLITLLLVLTGMVTTASADNWYVVGQITGDWTPTPVNDKKAFSMTESSSISDVYYYDYTSVSTAAVYFAIANGDGTGGDNDAKWSDFNTNHRWATSTDDYGLDGSSDYDIATDNYGKAFMLTPSAASITYRIVFNADTKKLSCVQLGDYVVAGCYRPGKDSSRDEASCYGDKWNNTLASNRMTLQDDGIYVKSFNNVQLTEAGEFWYRAVIKGSVDGTAYKKDLDTPYTYDIVIQKKIGSNETISITESAISDFYVYGGLGTGDWSLSATAMDKESGVFSVEFSKPSATNYYRFALAPNTIIKDGVVFNTSRLVRPSCGKTADWILNTFVNINNYWVTTNTNEGDAWQFPTSMSECDWAFSYDSNELQWSVSPSFTRTLPVAAEGYATFSSTYDVIPGAGLTAKYASAVNITTGKITWENYPATGIKAEEGALLTGTAGETYRFTPASSAVAPTTNLLKPILEKQKISGNNNYILSKPSTKVGFFKVNSDGGSWCSAGTAYLETPVAARDYFWIDDETTGIEAVDVTPDTVKEGAREYYNLNGQRVMNPSKGLYIFNGKKLIIK